MKVVDILNTIHPLSKDLKLDILSRVKNVDLVKANILLKEGQISNHIYFIEKGLLRAYYYKSGKEINAWFMQEDDFIISVYSFYEQVPSTETIEALEDCSLSYISFNDLMELYEKHIEFNIVGRVLTTHYYIKSEERNHILRKMNAELKYKFFYKNYPELMQRIPQYHIASYLGISTETLSRVRKNRK